MTDPVELVLSKLEKVRQHGKQWMACCPAHPDREPSLSIKRGDDDRVLLKCFAGCTYEAIMRAIDLDLKEGFVPTEKTDRPPTVIWSHVADYTYADETGKPVYQVRRMAGSDGSKKFTQRRPDGTGGWINNLDGVERVLYRLPQLLEWIADDAYGGSAVWIVEGERDVHTAAEHEMFATTMSGGTSGWRPEFAQHFVGTGWPVCIVADRDKTGYTHAARVAADLWALGIDSIIFEAAVDKIGADLSDHFAAGLEVFDLWVVSMASAIKEGAVRPTPDPEFDDGATVNVALDGYRLTDTGNSERLIALADGKLRYVNAWSRWIVYADGRWTVDTSGALVTEFAKRVARNLFSLLSNVSDSRARDLMFAWAKRSESSGAIAAMVNLARGNPAILTQHEDLDAQAHLLNCRNGTVDLRTGKLRPHDPADLLTLQTNVAYNPAAPRPLWDSCLARWQPDDEIRRYLQLEAGAGATGRPTETLSVHYGSGGNGKSKFWGAVQHALGDYATVPHKSLLMARHEQHETVKADLFRRRLGIVSESKSADTLDEEQVKAITGGDRMRARRMREDTWTFDPTHTLILFTNHKPTISGRDEAIWRRVRLVPWMVTIPEAERDEELSDKLNVESRGILTWVVEGARRFLTEGFAPPAAVRAATGAYRSDEDLVGRFVTEVLAFGGGYTYSAELVVELDRWCRDQGIAALDMGELAPELEHDCRSRRQGSGGNRATVWIGVTIRDERETQ